LLFEIHVNSHIIISKNIRLIIALKNTKYPKMFPIKKILFKNKMRISRKNNPFANLNEAFRKINA
jgi:hypothetical protein